MSGTGKNTTVSASAITPVHRATLMSVRRAVQEKLNGRAAFGAFEPVDVSVAVSGVTTYTVLVVDKDDAARRVQVVTKTANAIVSVEDAKYVDPVAAANIVTLANAYDAAVKALALAAADEKTLMTPALAERMNALTAAKSAASQALAGMNAAATALNDKAPVVNTLIGTVNTSKGEKKTLAESKLKTANAERDAASTAYNTASAAYTEANTKRQAIAKEPAVVAAVAAENARSNAAVASVNAKKKLTDAIDALKPQVHVTAGASIPTPTLSAYFGELAGESTLRATVGSLKAGMKDPTEAAKLVETKLKETIDARKKADVWTQVKANTEKGDWPAFGKFVEDERAAQFIDASVVGRYDAWGASKGADATKLAIDAKLAPIRIALGLESGGASGNGAGGGASGLIGEADQIIIKHINAGEWRQANQVVVSAKGASPTAAIVYAAVEAVKKANADQTTWSSDMKTVLTTLCDAIDGTTLAPVLAQATAWNGANKAVVDLASFMRVMSMLSPSEIAIGTAVGPQPLPPSQLPGTWVVRETHIRVPKSKLDSSDNVFAAAKAVFDATSDIAPTTRLPTGRRVQLGAVIVHELLKLAIDVMKDTTWSGKPHEEAAWINRIVGQDRLQLFAPVSVGNGAYGPVVSGVVWSGWFTVSRLQFGAMVVFTGPTYTIVVTIV